MSRGNRYRARTLIDVQLACLAEQLARIGSSKAPSLSYLALKTNSMKKSCPVISESRAKSFCLPAMAFRFHAKQQPEQHNSRSFGHSWGAGLRAWYGILVTSNMKTGWVEMRCPLIIKHGNGKIMKFHENAPIFKWFSHWNFHLWIFPMVMFNWG